VNKIETLVDFLQQELQKPVLEADIEFCSWGLSAMGELVAGNEQNRETCMGLGAKKLVLGAMKNFPNDVYVQWQGCMVSSVLLALHCTCTG
jgi:hypothetical protein